MLKRISLLCLLVPLVLSVPVETDKDALRSNIEKKREGKDYSQSMIVRSENTNPGTGHYNWAFATEDQQTHEQTGSLKKPFAGSDLELFGVEGTYSYLDTEGKKVTVRYIADHKGYRETRTYE